MNKEFAKLMSSFSDKIYTLPEVKDLLMPWLYDLKDYYEDVLFLEDGDSRTGFETFGYTEDDRTVNRLDYISDMWQNSTDTRWIINLLDPKY